MPCDTARLPGQTLAARVEEVRESVKAIDKLVAARKVQMKVGPQGAVTFTGLADANRNRMTDACIYRTLMRTGSAATKLAIARAEQLAGRRVDARVVAQGTHSHDGGTTWHPRG